jgi:hypothetical protein
MTTLTSRTEARLLSIIAAMEEPHKSACTAAWNACFDIAAEPPLDQNARNLAVVTAMKNLIKTLREANLVQTDEELPFDLTDLLCTILSESGGEDVADSWLPKMLPKLDRPLTTDQLARLFLDDSPSESANGEVPKTNFSPGKTLEAFKSGTTYIIPKANDYGSYLDRIDRDWQSCTDSILNVGITCHEANWALSKPAKQQLVKELPFSPSTFSKLAKIGRDKRLRIKGIRKRLPPSLSIIYEVCRLTHEQLRDALIEGILKPNMQRKEILRWKGVYKQRNERKMEGITERESPTLPEEFYAGLKLKRQLTTIEFAQLEKLLKTMENDFEVEVSYPYSKGTIPLYQVFLNRFRLEARMRFSEAMEKRENETDPDGSTIERDDILDDSRLAAILGDVGKFEELENIRRSAFLDLLNGRNVPQWYKDLKNNPPPRPALDAEFEHFREELRPLLNASREERMRAAFQTADA